MQNRAKTKAGDSPPQTNGSAKGGGSKGNTNNKGGGRNNHNIVQQSGQSERLRLKADRQTLVMWKRPIVTLKYFVLECLALTRAFARKMLQRKALMGFILSNVLFIIAAYLTPGRHQRWVGVLRFWLWYVIYWVGLGILSSAGLGMGLHTFLFYLGPFISRVTMAAYDCHSLDFPRPPYPDEIVCPEGDMDTNFVPSVWSILAKVRLEAILWGVGTAIGELPPYFMAKAARVSGEDVEENEDLAEFEELQRKQAEGQELSLFEKGKVLVERIVEKVGFFGILVCASIPNPLFDLAGITCGHFRVPFTTFFGATVIGKAIIKMHLQVIFVIMVFSEPLIKKVIDIMGHIPVVGPKVQVPFKTFLESQERKYRSRQGGAGKGPEKVNILAKAFDVLVFAMVLYFVISIVNALAQNYHKRLHKKKTAGAASKTKTRKD